MQLILLSTVLLSLSPFIESLPSGNELPGQSTSKPNQGNVTSSGPGKNTTTKASIPKDSVPLPTNGSFWYLDRLDGVVDNKYTYPKKAGEGVDIYVLDTGVNTQHAVFEGRATSFNVVAGKENKDLQGHGTFVAGIAAMVARKANIIGVKIMDDAGFSWPTGNPAGNYWAEGIRHAVNEIKRKKKEQKSVIHMSVGTLLSLAIQDGIEASVVAALEEAKKAGITVVVAAGNLMNDACTILPTANASFVITVANVQQENKLNVEDLMQPTSFGPCIDIAAYGTNITSAVGTSDYGMKTGTSFAAPIVSGLAAILLSMGIPASDILSKLQSLSSTDAIVQGLKFGHPPQSKDAEQILLSTKAKVASLELIDSLN
ncbi:peptidase S8/S53 domain-containing protein [Paraphysoderma sedebokerense]|nr:peptidase S8/S53 domain-containing protein [Paraphysoderma sedebokerense]